MSRRTKKRTLPGARPLRVGFVTPCLGMGGAERWVLTLARHLSQRITVSGILAARPCGPLAAEARRLAPVLHAGQCGGLMETSDVIVAWGWERLAEDFSGFRGRLIAVSHGEPMLEFSRRMAAAMERYPGVERLGISRSSLRVWSDPAPKFYIPNGVEADRCTPRLGRTLTRRALGLGDDAKVALCVARIATEKRPELFAAAVAELPEEWTGVIAGTDLQGLGSVLRQYPRMVVAPPQETPGDLLAAADVFVLPSLTEGHPLALTEAWLAGVPTVYCDWEFASQLRDAHGSDAGEVCPVQCPAADLAAAVLRAAAPENTARTAAARAVAWEHYTASAMAARWERYLLGRAACAGAIGTLTLTPAPGPGPSAAGGYSGG